MKEAERETLIREEDKALYTHVMCLYIFSNIEPNLLFLFVYYF